MHDDDLMDRFLTETMSASDVPELTAEFDERVIRRIRRRRLSPGARAILVLYVLMAVLTTVWLMRDIPADVLGIAAAAGVSVVVGMMAYVRRFVAIS
jgi:hypothetical protein